MKVETFDIFFRLTHRNSNFNKKKEMLHDRYSKLKQIWSYWMAGWMRVIGCWYETNIWSLVRFETNIFVGRTLDKYIGWSDMRQIMVANQIYKLQTGDKHLPLLLRSLNKQNASNVSDEPSKPLFTSITSARVKVWIPVWARPAQYFFPTCSLTSFSGY